MATNKTQAKGNKSITHAAQHGLKGFNPTKIVNALKKAAQFDATIQTAAESRAAQAFKVCELAQEVRDQNKTLDREAWSNSWRSSIKGILPRLHAAKVPWVEQTENKAKDGSVSIGYKLTGYGQNISSNANQVGQYNIDAKMAGSLQSVRKAIAKVKQAENDSDQADAEAADPNLATLRAHREDLAKGFALVTELLAEAASVEAYELTLAVVADLVEANSIPEIESSEEGENDAEIAELMQAAG